MGRRVTREGVSRGSRLAACGGWDQWPLSAAPGFRGHSEARASGRAPRGRAREPHPGLRLVLLLQAHPGSRESQTAAGETEGGDDTDRRSLEGS